MSDYIYAVIGAYDSKKSYSKPTLSMLCEYTHVFVHCIFLNSPAAGSVSKFGICSVYNKKCTLVVLFACDCQHFLEIEQN